MPDQPFRTVNLLYIPPGCSKSNCFYCLTAEQNPWINFQKILPGSKGWKNSRAAFSNSVISSSSWWNKPTWNPSTIQNVMFQIDHSKLLNGKWSLHKTSIKQNLSYISNVVSTTIDGRVPTSLKKALAWWCQLLEKKSPNPQMSRTSWKHAIYVVFQSWWWSLLSINYKHVFFTQIRMIWKKCLSRIGKIRVFLWFFSVLPIISSQKFHQPKLSNRHLTAPFSFPFSAPPNLDEKIGALSGGKIWGKMDGCKACFKQKKHGKSTGNLLGFIGNLLDTHDGFLKNINSSVAIVVGQ